MVKYDPIVIENIDILTDKQKKAFEKVSNGVKLHHVIANRSLVDKLSFGFVYTSARIEGNHYTLEEAELLLTDGTLFSSHSLDDAIMLRNISSALRYCLGLDLFVCADSVKFLHKILMNGFVVDNEPFRGGERRDIPVVIRGSDYKPLDNFKLLEQEFNRIFEYYEKIENPYERAIYIHDNLAYLQYFRDGNKRVARVACALSLINSGLPFFAFNEIRADSDKVEYLKALKSYYETHKHDDSVELFFKQHQYVNELAEFAKVKDYYPKSRW